MEKKKNNFIKQAGWFSILVSALALIAIIAFGLMPNSDTTVYKGILGSVTAFFANSILGVSKFLGNSYGYGIIGFTILIRFLILPLMAYSTSSSKSMAKVTPLIKKVQDKYKGKRDRDSMTNMQAETSAIYKEAGVNPYASLLPVIIQLPVLWALFQAVSSTPTLKTGSFFWLQLGKSDPYFILPILAALFTFISSWMSTASLGKDQPGFAKAMPYIFPFIIFFSSMAFPSALSLYWVATNAFQVVQTFFLQNPFKARAEERMAQQAETDRKRAITKTLRKSRKRRK
ncbi:membrane protein insertase YidC [Oenococcus sicerae]|uniref:Membrane protein insertase YidC n=1 Tax=Oenococcus sicerae TaxID=2203724 RepID=A0AAJ1VQD0_9LACO|nr:YidC/Oxa1 family membrane protein insertase [Oenococcus sicerae]MDN6900052.1 membrane protein insertase YidC [Oenococcus sicerae]QAS69661.1 membrane protein insertase YidC [Oenococcus sicerae]